MLRSSGSWYYLDEDNDLTLNDTTLIHTIENDGAKDTYLHSVQKTIDLQGKLNAASLTGDVDIALVMYPSRKGPTADPGTRTFNEDPIMGDFVINQTNIRINNLLEADLNNDAFKTVDEELSLYDTGYINYQSSKLLYIALRYQTTDSWTDALNTSKSLQNHYILNRGNLYNSSCAILNMTIIDPDVEVNIDDIFVFNNLEDDLGNPMKFYVDDLRFNVKKHIYAVKLKQWLADVGKDIS